MATIMMLWNKAGAVKGSCTAEKSSESPEAPSPDYKAGWIDLNSFSYTIDRNIKQGVGQSTNREAAHPVISKITVGKPLDNASPNLYFESILGNEGKGLATPTVTIHFCSADTKEGKMRMYARFNLTNVLIAKYKQSGEADGAPKEELDLSWTNIEFCYWFIDETNTLSGKKAGYTYNLATTTAAVIK